jgi:hypothetical protein
MAGSQNAPFPYVEQADKVLSHYIDGEKHLCLDAGGAFAIRSPEFFNRLPLTAHGLVTGDIGKPIGMKSDGSVVVWNEQTLTEYPFACLHSIVNVNLIRICGWVVSVPKSLFPADLSTEIATNNNRFFYWKKATPRFEYTPPAGSVTIQEIIYVVMTDPTDSNKVLTVPQIPNRPVSDTAGGSSVGINPPQIHIGTWPVTLTNPPSQVYNIIVLRENQANLRYGIHFHVSGNQLIWDNADNVPGPTDGFTIITW